MTDFKVGDRVEYKATDSIRTKDHEGREGIVTKIEPGHFPFTASIYVKFDGDAAIQGVLSANLRLITPAPAPDVITIDRSELPKITTTSAWLMDGDWAIGGAHMDANTARHSALRYLAAAEYLEAREHAEKEAAADFTRRRDELARGFTNDTSNFDDLPLAARAAIDRIIELTDAAGK